MERVCPVCGDAFTTVRGRRYCTARCARDARRTQAGYQRRIGRAARVDDGDLAYDSRDQVRADIRAALAQFPADPLVLTAAYELLHALAGLPSRPDAFQAVARTAGYWFTPVFDLAIHHDRLTAAAAALEVAA